MIQIDESEWELHDVAGDGNCFFRAVLAALSLSGHHLLHQDQHFELRKEVMNYAWTSQIEKDSSSCQSMTDRDIHKDLLSRRVPVNSDFDTFMTQFKSSWHLWIWYHQQNGTYASELVWQKCAHFLNIRLTVFAVVQNTNNILIVPLNKQKTNKPWPPIYLLLQNDHFYVLIHPSLQNFYKSHESNLKCRINDIERAFVEWHNSHQNSILLINNKPPPKHVYIEAERDVDQANEDQIKKLKSYTGEKDVILLNALEHSLLTYYQEEQRRLEKGNQQGRENVYSEVTHAADGEWNELKLNPELQKVLQNSMVTHAAEEARRSKEEARRRKAEARRRKKEERTKAKADALANKAKADALATAKAAKLAELNRQIAIIEEQLRLKAQAKADTEARANKAKAVALAKVEALAKAEALATEKGVKVAELNRRIAIIKEQLRLKVKAKADAEARDNKAKAEARATAKAARLAEFDRQIAIIIEQLRLKTAQGP